MQAGGASRRPLLPLPCAAAHACDSPHAWGELLHMRAARL